MVYRKSKVRFSPRSTLTNEPAVRGKKVDLNVDSPPDLVVEVDITHTDINKTALYAEMGVGEFWRYNGKTLTIYQLQPGQYCEVSASPTFSWVQKERLYQFLNDCAEQGETVAKRSLRNWIRQHLDQSLEQYNQEQYNQER